jgi:hypothetical protein
MTEIKAKSKQARVLITRLSIIHRITGRIWIITSYDQTKAGL